MKVMIGYDPRQTISYVTLVQSLIETSSIPLEITALRLETLPIKRQGLTPFTYSRFLVPYLCRYEGHAIFLDSDMLVAGDIAELVDYFPRHEQVATVKGKERFEWASLMIFNNAECRHLTPEYVETAKGLHTLEWATSIKEIPAEWNHCIGYDDPKGAKLYHYTMGVPAWSETKHCEHAKEWNDCARRATMIVSYQELMGNSVHEQKRLKGQI